jgi:hypothetical protein
MSQHNYSLSSSSSAGSAQENLLTQPRLPHYFELIQRQLPDGQRRAS